MRGGVLLGSLPSYRDIISLLGDGRGLAGAHKLRLVMRDDGIVICLVDLDQQVAAALPVAYLVRHHTPAAGILQIVRRVIRLAA